MDNIVPKPWELHPALVHFPIAFLLGGVVLLLWAWWRANEIQHRVAAGMLLVGMVSGWLAIAAGGLAYFTVPAHTEQGHVLMYWHLGFGLTMLILFTWLSIVRWRERTKTATKLQLIAAFCGVVLLMLTGYLGGSIVYHYGAGVDPKILAPEIREGHSHGNSEQHSGSAHQH